MPVSDIDAWADFIIAHCQRGTNIEAIRSQGAKLSGGEFFSLEEIQGVIERSGVEPPPPPPPQREPFTWDELDSLVESFRAGDPIGEQDAESLDEALYGAFLDFGDLTVDGTTGTWTLDHCKSCDRVLARNTNPEGFNDADVRYVGRSSDVRCRGWTCVQPLENAQELKTLPPVVRTGSRVWRLRPGCNYGEPEYECDDTWVSRNYDGNVRGRWVSGEGEKGYPSAMSAMKAASMALDREVIEQAKRELAEARRNLRKLSAKHRSPRRSER